MRLLKTVHGWLGVIVLPWVILIGLTGLFLNHERLVMGWLEGDAYDETQFDTWPGAKALTANEARVLAERLYPGVALTQEDDTAYHGREAAVFAAGDAQVIVALQTGHYWVKTDLRRVTHSPDGLVLETRTYWEGIFKRLHERGWLTRSFGTLLADITAAAMVIFGLSGIILFLIPRLRRRQNRRRMRAAATP
ncbi:PepSY-associated TM helix domain-containing protein [Tabrizicola sp.]|uniref:PepSY-associated TM helix domain-containing protein n=1 Tax=Tabrizicola sp. TaxID=2005166 RepID=UPI002735D90D|nr:PepSY-associated TM helix domain-containing protein [Tabrizicola sp.]MDP3194501.1 PepSY-associated TM helix domain-containing protein [Tabrizicola sp.]